MKMLITHDVKMHKAQTICVVISVALSVAIALVLGLVGGGVEQGAVVSDERGGADFMVIPQDGADLVEDTDLLYTGAPVPMYMDQTTVDKIASIATASQVTGQFFSQTLGSECCSTSAATRLIGVDFSTDFVVKPLIENMDIDALGSNELILGSDVNGLSDGTFTVVGTSYKVVGHLAATGSDLDQSIIADIDVARDISRNSSGFEHYWSQFGDPKDLVSCVMVNASDGQGDYDKLKTALNLTEGISYVEHSTASDDVQKQMQTVLVLLAAAAIIMLIVCILQIFARFYSVVWDRKAELALYRALGASKKDIRRLIAGEVSLLVGMGIVVGLVLGSLLYIVLLGFMAGMLTFPFIALAPFSIVGLVVGIVVIFFAIALIAMVRPLAQIAKLDPSFAMQQTDIG